MRVTLALVPLAGIALAAASPAPRDVPAAFAGMPRIAFRYYDVSGRDEQQIYASLMRNVMRGPDGETASGLTRWGMRYRWGEYTDRRGCSVRDPRVDLDITVTLPRLADPDRASPRGRAWWEGYKRTIERHEAGHARIAFEHRDDFLRAAEGARCDEIKAIGDRVTARIAALQNDYDRITEHGQKQERWSEG